jgi:hypothetical protein
VKIPTTQMQQSEPRRISTGLTGNELRIDSELETIKYKNDELEGRRMELQYKLRSLVYGHEDAIAHHR